MIKKEKESRDIKEKGFIQKEAFDIKKERMNSERMNKKSKSSYQKI